MPAYLTLLEAQARGNTFYRKVLYTGRYAQLVLMCLAPGEEIGNEAHNNADQFIRIEEGEGLLVLSNSDPHVIRAGDGVVVPAGTFHNVINKSSTKPLKLYTVYTTPQEPPGTVQRTKPAGG